MKKKKKLATKMYFDYALLFVTAFIIGFGLLMIYSTSSYTAQMDYGDPEHYFKRQLIFVVIGLILMLAAYKIDYHLWHRLAVVIFVLSILLVFALIPFGSSANGATRWIRFGPIGVQPADVSKIAVIIMVASAVCSYGRKMDKFKNVVIICAATAGLMAVVVYLVSNNLSSALIIFLIAVVMTFVAYRGYKIYVAAGVLGITGAAAIYAYFKSHAQSIEMTGSFRFNRIMVWTNPENYASGKGYQTVQSLYAIGSGGVFGKGLGKSLQKLGFIPESQNDMIFAVICEELGLFGAVILLAVFAFMLSRIIHVAQNAPDLFGSLLCVGVFAHIAIQVLLNVAVVTNFIPNTGVSLPFISYGGSSLIVLMMEIGMVLNVSSKIKLEI